jgi:hypothetical protein
MVQLIDDGLDNTIAPEGLEAQQQPAAPNDPEHDEPTEPVERDQCSATMGN